MAVSISRLTKKPWGALCRWCSGEPKEVLKLLRSAMEHTGEEDNTPFTFSEDVAKAALANDLAAGAQKTQTSSRQRIPFRGGWGKSGRAITPFPCVLTRAHSVPRTSRCGDITIRS